MRYAIGCEFIKKENGEKYNGYYVNGKYGFAYVLTDYAYEKDCNDDCKPSIKIFDKAEDAILFSQILARAYRRDDCGIGYNPIKSKYIRKFYPVKVDSSNFPYKLELKEGRKSSIKKDRFGKKSNKAVEYNIYEIAGKK